MWSQADARVRELRATGADVLVVWDGSVWEKPERQTSADWCVVRSAKARRLTRRRTGLTRPPSGPPILVPGLHWDGLIEGVWRVSKSALAFESPRVQDWEVRQKLLLLATLAYAFLLHVLDPSLADRCAHLLRVWCHRTGKR